MTRVLFVEDEPRGVNAYFQALERDGFSCVLATDVKTAISRLQADKFEMLSLDIGFSLGKEFNDTVEPRLAGLHLLKQIRAGKIPNCDANLKVIVLTAVVSRQVEEEIRRLGVFDYLKKPIDFERAIETFKNARG